jgi:hypothetical protein
MSNKIAVIAMTLLIMISSFIVVQGSVRATISGDYGYSIINGTEAEITSYAGAGGAVVIPNSIDGYSITSIGDYAFYSSTVLTAVTIPDGVTHIGNAAFYGCGSLTSVALPNSLVSMDDYAFTLTGLKSVNVPAGVDVIGDSVFSDCHYLTSITLSKSLTSIGSGDFANCFNLTSVVIPEYVRSIGDGAFYNCRSLTSFDIPRNVTSIGNSVFQGCAGLSTINLGLGLTSIDYAAFSDCTSLTSITIPDGVTDIGYGAFSGCSAMTSLKLGNGVTGIGALTFFDCRSLTFADIPDSVATIGYGAFYNCTSLSSVTVGSGVTDIGKSAFGNCSSLISITFKSNQPSLAIDWFPGYSSGLVIQYYTGASGFTNPLWQGIPTEMRTRLAAPQNVMAVPGPGFVSLSWNALSGNGSDSIDYYVIYEDGAEVARATSGTALNISAPANGHTHSFQIAGHDLEGVGLNSSSVIGGSFYDPNLMKVNITSPAEGSFLASGNVNVTWTIGADLSSIAYLNISLDDGTPIILPVNSTSYSFQGLVEGKHSVTVSGVDGPGVTSFVSVSFSVDTTAPTTVLTSPKGDQVSTRTAVVVNFSEAMNRTATGISLAGVTGAISWNGSTATFLPVTTLIGNMTYTVSLVGKDLSGNALKNVSWTFTTADVGTISGIITDPGGNPVANATVSLVQISGSAPSNSEGLYAHSTLTDVGGNYAFYDVMVGNYTLTVTKDGYVPSTSSLALTPEAIATGGITAAMVISPPNQANDIVQEILIVAIAVMVGAVLLVAAMTHRKGKKT